MANRGGYAVSAVRRDAGSGVPGRVHGL